MSVKIKISLLVIAKMIKFDTQVQRQYASALQSSERQITESKILKQIFNIIEKVENDELV